MLEGFQHNVETVSASASGAITDGQAVVLSYSSGVLTATAATAGTRVDGWATEPKASGEQVAIRLQPGVRLQVGVADGAISAGAYVYTTAAGQVSATANGSFAGVALTASGTANDAIIILGQPTLPNVKFFRAVASAGDATNGYVEFTHSFGSNPAGFIPYAVNGSTGAPRVIASVTNTSTSVQRVTVTSLAANDIVSLITWRAAI